MVRIRQRARKSTGEAAPVARKRTRELLELEVIVHIDTASVVPENEDGDAMPGWACDALHALGFQANAEDPRSFVLPAEFRCNTHAIAAKLITWVQHIDTEFKLEHHEIVILRDQAVGRIWYFEKGGRTPEHNVKAPRGETATQPHECEEQASREADVATER